MKKPSLQFAERAFFFMASLLFLLGVFAAFGFRCIGVALQFDDFPACIQV